MKPGSKNHGTIGQQSGKQACLRYGKGIFEVHKHSVFKNDVVTYIHNNISYINEMKLRYINVIFPKRCSIN